jgi:hypothetical protein
MIVQPLTADVLTAPDAALCVDIRILSPRVANPVAKQRDAGLLKQRCGPAPYPKGVLVSPFGQVVLPCTSLIAL